MIPALPGGSWIEANTCLGYNAFSHPFLTSNWAMFSPAWEKEKNTHQKKTPYQLRIVRLTEFLRHHDSIRQTWISG